MKRLDLFITVFISAVILFSLLGAVSANIYMSAVRTSTNNTILQIVSSVRENYPEIDDTEIIKILNSRSDTSDTEKLLKTYGILETSWTVLENEEKHLSAVVNNSLFFLAGGMVMLGIFLIYAKMQKQDIIHMTEYLSEINKGKYDLRIKENSESENSVLQNEIYKTTITLREQYQQSFKDKIALKDSISDISHQLKTPLTSIMIMLDNIIDDKDMPEDIKYEFICGIKNSAIHISFLIQSLLKLSRLDSNSVDFIKKPEMITDIFTDCIKNTEILAEIREVNVFSECDKGIKITCDKKWIVEALTNIVKNCIEHTPSNGSVTLSAQDSKFYTKITVADTGCGISEKELPHIFERFYKTRNSDENSVGIGLSLSKAIIEHHNGYILTDSTVGKGTVFTVKFLKNV